MNEDGIHGIRLERRSDRWGSCWGPNNDCWLSKREQKSTLFGDIDGVLKQDWTRTGNIDFHAGALESTSPQLLVLRVEEKKITENAMAQDIAQLRWRLATLEEAKEVVVCWNAGKSERNPERRGALLKSA